MDDLERGSAALTAAPLGCAFLSGVELAGLSPAEAADPHMSFHVLVRALSDVTVWRRDHAVAVPAILAKGPRLRPLARAVLARPETAWWFGPLQRRAQFWATDRSVMPAPPAVPARPPSKGERYAQRPFWGLYTSTEFGGLSAYVVGASQCSGDLGPLAPPVARYRLAASDAARVFAVDGPDAWRRLRLTYPASDKGGLLGGLLVPVFAAAARDWDAVHLGLGGLLTAEQVRMDGPGGPTELQG